MTFTDIATRTYNHGWRLDPIVRSLLDTDFYKLLMLQMIREFYPEQRVTFSVINRSKQVRLAEVIDEGELREQLDHVRTLSLTRGESTWLRGFNRGVGTARRSATPVVVGLGGIDSLRQRKHGSAQTQTGRNSRHLFGR